MSRGLFVLLACITMTATLGTLFLLDRVLADEQVSHRCPEEGEPSIHSTCGKDTKRRKAPFDQDTNGDGKLDRNFGPQFDDVGNIISCWCIQKNAADNRPNNAIYYSWTTAAGTVWIGGCFFKHGHNEEKCTGLRNPDGSMKEYTTWDQTNVQEPPQMSPTGTKLQDHHFNKDTVGGKCHQGITWGHYEKNAQGKYEYVTDDFEGWQDVECAKSPGEVKAPVSKSGEGGGAGADTPASQPGLMVQEWTLVGNGTLAPTWRYTLANPGRVDEVTGDSMGMQRQISANDRIIVNGGGITGASVVSPANSATNGGWVVESFTSTIVTYRATAPRVFNVGQSLSGFRLVSTAAAGQVRWSYFNGNSLVTRATTTAPGGVVKPTPVTNLVAQSGDRSVHLSWTHTPQPGHQGYRVYRLNATLNGHNFWDQLHVPLVTTKSFTDTEYTCPFPGPALSYSVTVAIGPNESEGSNVVAVLPACNMFLRGDADASGVINITDCTYIWNWLFQGGPEPPCMEAADADDTAEVDVSDGSYLCEWLFRGGPEPPAPGPFSCGFEPAGTSYLGCASYTTCP